MRRGCGVGSKRLCTAQANRQLEDLQRVQELERRRLTAQDIEGEGGTCATALRGKCPASRRCRVRIMQIVDLLDLRVVAQEIGDRPCIAICPFRAYLQSFQRTAEHPAGMRIELCADRSSQRLDLLDQRLWAGRRTGNLIGMAAHIFG